MRNSMMRPLGAAVLSIGLMAAAAPTASAATADFGPVVTVKGHVRDAAGDPIKGITVQSDCGCGFEPGGAAQPTHLLGKDTTDARGYYAFRVRKDVARNIHANDSTDTYLAAARDSGSTKKTGTGYRIDLVMQQASEIAGTVRDTHGNTVDGVYLQFFDATTGEEVASQGVRITNEAGRYHALLPGGSYKIKVGESNSYYTESWLGGAPTKETSPTVTVAPGGKTAGVNGTVTALPTINGSITVDGAKPIESTDRPAVDLYDGAGVQVDSTVSYGNNFSFIKLQPGTYTVVVRPSTKGSAYFTPVSTPATVTADTAVEGLVVNVTSLPGSASDKRSVGIRLTKTTTDSPAKGDKFTAHVLVESYGDVTGGRLDIYVGGKKLASKVVPADGVVRWSTRFGGVKPGMRTVYAKFRGTDTTQARTVFQGTFRVES